MVRKNLEDYYKRGSKVMFRYIVTQAVGRIFENVNFEYYHMSVATFCIFFNFFSCVIILGNFAVNLKLSGVLLAHFFTINSLGILLMVESISTNMVAVSCYPYCGDKMDSA
jgi:hypothetical protein